MILRSSRNVSDRGGVEPPATNPLTNDREEESVPKVTRTHHDDNASPNPFTGRQTFDGVSLKTRGRTLCIGTWNVRTMFQAGKIDNIVQEMTWMNNDILGLCETRWTDNGKVTYENHTLVYSGGKEHSRGVGIIMKNTVAASMIGYFPISERVMMLKLKGQPFDISIIQGYAPTSDYSDNEVEMFYDEMKNAMKYVKCGEVVIVMGDFNAKVGNEKHSNIVGKYGLGTRNDRGRRLIQFCEEYNLMVTNTWFQHPKRRLYTWKSPGDLHRNQIDFILVNQRFRNTVKQARTYPGADVGSDHNPVVVKMNIKVKRPPKRVMKDNLDMNMLKNEEIRDSYAVEVQNQFQLLENEEVNQVDETEIIEEKWSNLKNCLVNSAKKILPKKKKVKRKSWMNDEILKLMEERKKHKGKTKYKEIDQQIKRKCKEAKEIWWNMKCSEIENLEKEHKTKEMHDKVKEMSNKRRSNQGSNCICDKNGQMLFDAEDITNRWVEYVEDLYFDERGTLPDIMNDDGQTILQSEVEGVIKDMKIGKASGNDEITTEMLKALNDVGIKRLTEICNLVYEHAYIPSEMNQSIFVRLPKKQKATNCSEYRTLSLMSHVLKIMLKIVLLRSRRKIEEEIDEAQSGFMTGKGTREGIFNLRTIIERYLDNDKVLYMCFIDYEKAFDRVNHEKLIQCLQQVDINGKDLKLIRNLYWNQKAFIRTDYGLSPEIQIKRGVRQGCVLSPCLFNLYTENIFRETKCDKGIKIGGKTINNLRYADDTVLLAETKEDLQLIINEVNKVGKEYGMKMNANKTKTMVITRKENTPQIKLEIDGTEIKQVQNFKYLGQTISDDGKCDVEITKRIEIARGAFNNLKGALLSSNISLNTKKRIIKCYVWSTLLYGCETWTVTQSHINKLQAFEMWVYRKLKRISWMDKITNEDVLKKVNAKRYVVPTIKLRKISYFGHMVRRDNIHRLLLEGKIEGKRPRGRPRTEWTDNIKEWTGMPEYNELIRMAQDRKKWRIMTANLQKEEGTR